MVHPTFRVYSQSGQGVGVKALPVELQGDCWHRQVETPVGARDPQTVMLPLLLYCCRHIPPRDFEVPLWPVPSAFSILGVLSESVSHRSLRVPLPPPNPRQPFRVHNSTTSSMLNPQFRSLSQSPGLALTHHWTSPLRHPTDTLTSVSLKLSALSSSSTISLPSHPDLLPPESVIYSSHHQRGLSKVPI